MSPTITDETRRRIALDLLIRPPHRNRPRRRRRHYRFSIFTVLTCAVLLCVIKAVAIVCH